MSRQSQNPEPDVEDLTEPIAAALEADDWKAAIRAAHTVMLYAAGRQKESERAGELRRRFAAMDDALAAGRRAFAQRFDLYRDAQGGYIAGPVGAPIPEGGERLCRFTRRDSQWHEDWSVRQRPARAPSAPSAPGHAAKERAERIQALQEAA